MFHSIILPLLSKGFSLNLDLMNSSWPASPKDAPVSASPSPGIRGVGSFSHGYWELNSGPHANTVVTLPTETSLQPQDIL